MQSKIALLDRDGIIILERREYSFLPEHALLNLAAITALLAWQQAGFKLVAITNQAGVAKQLYTKQQVHDLHLLVEQKLAEYGISIDAWYACPHFDSIGLCNCRKPKGGMIRKALARFQADPALSFMVGDKERDVEAAQESGVRGFLVESDANLDPLLPLTII